MATVHEYTDSNAVTNWSFLIYIYQENDLGYLVNTGYLALNGPGIAGHGNYCWDNGNGSCFSQPLRPAVNQTVTVEALNNGNFMIRSRQI